MFKVKNLFCFILFCILSACSSKYYNQDENDFYTYLYHDYNSYADYKRGNYDWKGARIFQSKANKIKNGKEVLPINLPKKAEVSKFFPKKDLKPIEDMRQRMFLILKNEQAKKEFPEEVANLQFQHDCWVIEEQKYTKYSQIARCKQGFIDTLAYLEFKVLLVSEEDKGLLLKELDKDDIEVQVFVKPKKYIIYFDFDSSRITEDASRVIWEFLDDIKKIEKNYIINLKGHADRIGNKKYNQNLSKRRTETVKHYLVKNGVDASKIKVKWDGELDPRVITNNDFKEELNRRVEITINFID